MLGLVIQKIRADFPFLDAPIESLSYLDNASTTQMVRPALAAMEAFERDSRANVHRSVYPRAERATLLYEGARGRIAAYLGVPSDEVVFTSGTTGAINLVAHGFGNHLAAGDEIVISALDHHANLVPWQMLAQRRGVILRAIPITPTGRLDLTKLDQIVTNRCKLIAVTHASNVTGAITDVPAIVAAANRVGAAVLLDGAQTTRHGPMDLAALGVDFYAFSSHKCFGPTGFGVLWGKRERLAGMQPLMGGGDMIRRVTLEGATYADPPHRFEAGTPPIAAAIGLGAALDWIAAQDVAAMNAHEENLTERLMTGLRRIQNLRIIGPQDQTDRLGVVSFDLDGAHPHDVCQILGMQGVALRGGHHCAQPLMDALDLMGTNRISTAPYTTGEDIDRCLAAIAEAARKLL